MGGEWDDGAGERIAQPGWYDACGPQGARAVVLLHGSTLTRASWKPQTAALQDTYRLIVPDLPGHGALAGQPFRMDTAVEMVREAIERECGPMGSATLVGISLGGHIATLAAARFPRKVDGLVISGATMNFTGLTGAWTALVGRLMGRMNEDKMRAQAEKNIRKKWPAGAAEEIIAAGVYPMGAFQSFGELTGIDFRAALRQVEAPVLILNGGHDRANRRGEKAFCEAAKNARCGVIRGAGHACSIEQPDQYNTELRAFLDTLARVPAAK